MSMSPAVLLALEAFLTLLVPLAAAVWVANGRSPSRTHLLVKVLAGGLAVWSIYLVSVWPMTWYYLRYALPLIFGGAAVAAWWRARGLRWLPRSRVREWLPLATASVVLGVSGYVIADIADAHAAPDGAVEVAFPFQHGAFYVAQGGSHQGVNAHIAAHDQSIYRGQVWALDIVQINRFGRRARGLYPRDPRRYEIFGTPVVAPCAGTVVALRNDLPDLAPPERDNTNLPGNFVQIACEGGFYLLLAHLQQCSVQVRKGDRVAVGDLLGAIGNSGNTSEPHLHIHAQAGPGGSQILNADPIPLVFRGHGWLTRNDVVRVRAADPERLVLGIRRGGSVAHHEANWPEPRSEGRSGV